MDNEESDLRKALQFQILTICLQQDNASGQRTTTGAVRALTELVWQYLQQAMIPDLVAFSNHAGTSSNKPSRRNMVTTDDVALILRKLPDKLEQFQVLFPPKENAATATAGNRQGRSNTSTRRISCEGPGKRPRLSVPVSAGTKNQDVLKDRMMASSSSSSEDEQEKPAAGRLTSHKPISGNIPHYSLSFSSDEDEDDGLKAFTKQQTTGRPKENANASPTTSQHNTAVNSVTEQGNKSCPIRKHNQLQNKLPFTLSSSSSDNDDDLPSFRKTSLIETTSTKPARKKRPAPAPFDDDDEDKNEFENSPIAARNQKLEPKMTLADTDEDEDNRRLASRSQSRRVTTDFQQEPPQPPLVPKSQVADILANMEYDSEPEATFSD